MSDLLFIGKMIPA